MGKTYTAGFIFAEISDFISRYCDEDEEMSDLSSKLNVISDTNSSTIYVASSSAFLGQKSACCLLSDDVEVTEHLRTAFLILSIVGFFGLEFFFFSFW